MRILIADDDLLTRRLLEKILAKSGHEVVAAGSGSEAWQILSGQDPPALAILDWMMPQMTGVEVCRKVREAGGSAPSYLVVLTSRGQTDDLVTAFEAGADDYITKPFEAEELRARVSVGVRMVTLQQQLADRILALEESLAHVQQLQGLIPICAWCRQVRSDGNFWEKVESYLGKRSGLQFTHAICPTCKAKQTEGLKQLRPA
ncbi:MAG TPA: response regulator transcription factor [Methylomirabilota bacterium]|nr:response regulator transcription factor [Methylomirabilota bacterium]